MALCAHCKIEIENAKVVMADDSIMCYTCGRLKADMSCRGNDRQHMFVTLKVLEERKDLYVTD